MSYQLTKKEIRKEITKAGRDPAYFINNYVKISHPEKGLISFNLYDFQEDLLQNFNDYRFNVILKARQLGISTVTAAYVAWMMMFHREKKILVVATKFKTASNLVRKVKSIIKTLPKWMQLANISVDNQTSFELSNGSNISASTTSSDAGRSESLSLLVVDEAAHVEGLEELWKGLYPTLSTGGRCISLSTPNGVGNWFHKTCVEAETNGNGFHLTKLPWDRHPDRDIEWYKKETRNMSRRDVAQELECSFNMSGETVINPEDLEVMEKFVRDPKYKTGFDRNYYIWEEYDPTATYLMVADVARGDGNDYSVFHLLKLETMELVAEYQGKPNMDMFSNLLSSVGREYGNCLLVVENNNIGFSVLEKLIEINYPNLYYSVKSTHEFIEVSEAEVMSNSVPGFTTSSKTRPLIVAKLEEFIRNKILTTYSSRLINELRTFVWNNGKPQAMRGYNDDLIISLAIACWVRDTALMTSQRDIEYKKAILSSMISANTQMNTSIPGMLGYKKESSFDILEKERQQQQDFMWIYKG